MVVVFMFLYIVGFVCVQHKTFKFLMYEVCLCKRKVICLSILSTLRKQYANISDVCPIVCHFHKRIYLFVGHSRNKYSTSTKNMLILVQQISSQNVTKINYQS